MSGMTGMELRFGSGTDSEGRLPSSTKSCTFIWPGGKGKEVTFV